eukprot:CAMPEP_0175130564 /NCGR_PEP_ID=MMETSP0087-20121206/6073_1 /TAXON_ID=136419 /ORGANISM="Unknown Unknown, Strain D1" /LENGTH=303 /DNA_ID=CAMNT_0016412789 /DNA_START=33 /DNA_END=944 /DNA_ORIENTATION=+
MAGVDRLADLKATLIGVPSQSYNSLADDEPREQSAREAVAAYNEINQVLKDIESNTNKLLKLRDEETVTAEAARITEIWTEANALLQGTNASVKSLKPQLETIYRENQKFASDGAQQKSAQVQIRWNLYKTHLQKVHQCSADYSRISSQFKSNVESRSKRQLQVVDSSLSSEQIDEIVKSGRTQEVLQKAIMSDGAMQVFQDIQERHQAILHLAQQVHEVFELFEDLPKLVEYQQDALDTIESHVENARAYVSFGEGELIEAERHQTSARKKQCLILLCILILLGGTLGAVLPNVLSSSSSPE